MKTKGLYGHFKFQNLWFDINCGFEHKKYLFIFLVMFVKYNLSKIQN